MSGDSSYEFDAPRYVDFQNSNLENDGADRFFDIQMMLDKLKVEPNPEIAPPTLAKSENFSIKQEKMTPCGPGVEHSTALKEVSTNIMNVKDDAKGKKRFASPIPGHTQKFISLAEGVLLFSKKTPRRFHSKPKLEGFVKPKMNKLQTTIPKTPTLMCVNRTRKVDYPTQEEREEKLVEEMKSFHLKANPVKENVLHPPQLGKRVVSKPATKVEPFKLTSYEKKEQPKEECFKFSAKPVPKGLFEHPLGVPEKKAIPATVPKTPSITKAKVKILEEIDGQNVPVDAEACHFGVPSRWKPGHTTVKPFTFEERDKLMQKRKEEKIQQILQQEKEAREFHAHPLPNFLRKAITEQSPSVSTTFNGTHSSHCSNTSKDGSEANNSAHFKARPATVLQKEPFIPKKPERPALSTDEVVLHTELRAGERKLFEAHIHEKEEEVRRYLQMVEEEKERQRAEEIAQLRRAAIHKANPMPSFKSPQLSFMKKSPTVPLSPKFSDRFKK